MVIPDTGRPVILARLAVITYRARNMKPPQCENNFSSGREISTNTRVVRDGAGRVLEKTVTKTSSVKRTASVTPSVTSSKKSSSSVLRQETKNKDPVKRASTQSSVSKFFL